MVFYRKFEKANYKIQIRKIIASNCYTEVKPELALLNTLLTCVSQISR